VEIKVEGDFEKSIKRLKRDFEMNVLPIIKKHQFFQSKSQRNRMKLKKSIRKYKRLQRRYNREI